MWKLTAVAGSCAAQVAGTLLAALAAHGPAARRAAAEEQVGADAAKAGPPEVQDNDTPEGRLAAALDSIAAAEALPALPCPAPLPAIRLYRPARTLLHGTRRASLAGCPKRTQLKLPKAAGTARGGAQEEDEDSLAAPLAAAVGAPLLAPIADAFRRCGEARVAYASSLRTTAVEPLARAAPTPHWPLRTACALLPLPRRCAPGHPASAFCACLQAPPCAAAALG